MPRPFSVEGIDHVELFVSDWDEAAAWYQRVLGVTTDEAFEEWWKTGEGPLVLSVGSGAAKLALFERETATRGGSVSPRRVAFRTDGDGFLSFLDRLESLDLTNNEGKPVTPDDAVDHRLSYSIYFADPDGNPLEVTTYDHGTVAADIG